MTDHAHGDSMRLNTIVTYLIGLALFGLAAWFLWGAPAPDIPLPDGPVRPTVALADISTAPRRKTLSDPPMIEINGYKRQCMDCHKLFAPADDPPKRLLQHREIVLRHGINDRCRNCHDVENRNRLVLYGGASITYDEVVRLCAKCHGPVYEDWRRGMHGRDNGYWDTTRGKMIRRKCTECHDPHTPTSPAMDPIRPLPPPHTLRMGDPAKHAGADTEVSGVQDPLRKALDRMEHETRTLPRGSEETSEEERK